MLYDYNSLLIASTLLVLMLLAIWLGSKLGVRRLRRIAEAERRQVAAVQGSLLGLLALLIGFSFSLALQRHDDRSRAVVAEANAIGTAWLRTDLVDEPARTAIRARLRAYVAVRVTAASVTLADRQARARLNDEAARTFAETWVLASAYGRDRGTPVAMSLVAALNDVADSLGSRNAALERHVPELVLLLLFVTLICLAWVMGYASLVSGVRPSAPLIGMVLLIVVLVFLIVDLDRPRRGFIAVDQGALLDLARQIAAAAD